MTITLFLTGKTAFSYAEQGMAIFEKRIAKYIRFKVLIIQGLKNTKKLSAQEYKKKEGQLILAKIPKQCKLFLLDERGKAFSSVQFSKFIENKMISSTKELGFLVGGAFGFSADVYARAEGKIALSKMTYSHQLIRLVFMEQLYRAFTIINNEPYHNE